jgi:hypothetical protein
MISLTKKADEAREAGALVLRWWTLGPLLTISNA